MRYDIFISYAREHARLAARLARRIRTYRAPRALQLPARKLEVFRDEDRLTASASLEEELRRRIEAAEHLVLLCSPASAASRYVDQEVRTFLERTGGERILVALVEGEPPPVLPPSLRERLEEPLWIDLRIRRSPAGWRRFRRESLRIIAALLGVDFDTLLRADDRRRRRQRLAAAAAAGVAVLLVGAAFLVRSVGAEAWLPVALPTEHRGGPLLPIEELAVSEADPSVHLYRVRDARYANQRPELPIAVLGSGFLDGDFVPDALAHLRTAGETGVLRPVATLRFDVREGDAAARSEDRRQRGSGTVHVYGFRDRTTGGLGLVRTLDYRGVTRDGRMRTLRLEPAGPTVPADAFVLAPWPAAALIEAELLPEWGRITGTIRLAWDPEPLPADYTIYDAAETFIEANDGLWFDDDIASNADPRVILGADTFGVDDLEPDHWPEIRTTPGWKSHADPEPLKLSYDPRGLGDDSLPDRDLQRMLETALEDDGELFHDLTLTSGADVAMASVITERWDETARRAEPQTSRYFVRAGAADWRPTLFPAREPGTVVIDAFALDSIARRILALTDREGLYESRDGGESFRAFTFGEPLLRDGGSVRIIVAGEPPVIHAFVVRTMPDGEVLSSDLFRYHTRGWLERLRFGLAALFAPTTASPSS